MAEGNAYPSPAILFAALLRKTLALLLALGGILLLLIALVVVILNIPSARQALLDRGLAALNTEDMSFDIASIDGEWPGQLRLTDISIGDAEGIWLRLAHVTLDWRPLSLWEGELHVTNLIIEGLDLARLPAGSEGEQETSSGGFSIPSSPIGLRFDSLALKDMKIGKPVIGEAISFDAGGHFIHSRGKSDIAIELARTDATPGSVNARLTYADGPERGQMLVEASDGAPGKPGIVSRLSGISDFSALSLRAEGQSLAGLMTGLITLDAGRAMKAQVSLHGALAERLNLTLGAKAEGSFITRELASIGAPESVRLSARLAEPRFQTYALENIEVEAGELLLTGAATARQNRVRGRYDILAEGDFKGLPSLLGLEGADALSPLSWRINADAAETFEDILINEAAIIAPDDAATVTLTGAVNMSEALSITGEGDVLIPELATFRALTGQEIRGRLALNLSGFSFEAGAAEGEITITGDDMGAADAALARLLAPGLRGGAHFALRPDGSISLPNIALRAGNALRLDGAVALDAAGLPNGEAALHIADLAALLPDAGMAGKLDATARMEGAPATGHILLDATVTEGMLGGFDARRAVASVNIRNGNGPVSFTLDGHDGHAGLDTFVRLPEQGGASFENIKANLFGARLDGAIAISPEGLASGALKGERVALEPIGQIIGMEMDGRADIALDLDSTNNQQNASVDISSRLFDIQLTERLTLERLAIEADLKDITGNGTVDARIGADSGNIGNTRLTRIEATAKGPLEKLAINASLGGERLTLKAQPVSLELAALYEPNRLTLEQFDTTIAEASSRLAEPAIVELGENLTRIRSFALVFRGAGGEGSLTSSFTLQPRSARLDVNINRLPLEILTPLSPADITGGTLSGKIAIDTGREHADIALDIADMALMDADMTTQPRFSVSIESSWANRRLNLDARARGISEQPFILSASLPLRRDPQGAWPILPERGRLDGRLTWRGPIEAIMALVDLPGQKLTGEADIALVAEGDVSAPLLSGQARISRGTFENFSTGTLLRDLDLLIRGEQSEVLAFSMSAMDPGEGRIEAEGSISLAANASPAITINTRFNNMQLVRRHDLDLAVNGDISLTGETLPPVAETPLHLSGSLTTTTAQYRIPAQLPGGVATIDVIEVHGSAQQDALTDEPDAPPFPMVLDVALPIGTPPARVSGRGLDSLWGGNMKVTGPIEDFRLTGSIVNDRGTFDFAGKMLTIARGSVSFAGERDIDPLLDIGLHYERRDFEADIVVTGRSSSPKIDLTSNPSLPRDEIISHILFEKGVGELTALEAAQLANTLAELSGRGLGGMGILNQIQNSLGLDVLRVNQGASGNATVAAGKYLREGVYVGVEQGALASDSSVKVEIDITDNISVDTRIGQDATSDVGVNWKWDY